MITYVCRMHMNASSQVNESKQGYLFSAKDSHDDEVVFVISKVREMLGNQILPCHIDRKFYYTHFLPHRKTVCSKISNFG